MAKKHIYSEVTKKLLSFHVGDRVIFRALSLVPHRYTNHNDGKTYATVPCVGEERMLPREREYMASTYARVMEVRKHSVVIEVSKKLLGIHREQLKLFV
jgi:hypothetical protein